MNNQSISKDTAAKATLTFVIGASASGKTTFIQNHFSNDKIFNVYDYQQAAYKEAGFSNYVPFSQEFKCLYQANETLLADIIETLKGGTKNVVVEHTLFKAKRRIAYIDTISKELKNIVINIYVMCPSEAVWKTYISKRELNYADLKDDAKEIEFPNKCEGFNCIYEVVDDTVRPRIDAPKYELVETARRELLEETEKLRKENETIKLKNDLLESMNTRPFWHYCECCGKKAFITAKEAFDDGWDYPPQIGKFGLLGPRTCGDCSVTNTLFWKVQQQEIPIVSERDLTAEERKTWERIKNEPESLLKNE